MIRLCIGTLLSLLVFCAADTCSGQADAHLPYDPYFIETKDTVSEYGPWHITRELLQDKKGDIWLATWQGIIRYDGRLFTNYTLREGLIHFHVFSTFEDHKGNLWFGMPRGGVYRYDGKSFTLFTDKDGLTQNTVMCMTEDKKGNIWFGTEAGLSLYDGRRFTSFTTRDGIAGDYINSLMLDGAGLLWIGTNDGISRYDGKSFSSFNNKDGLPFRKVTSLFQDKAGRIWIGRMDGLTVYAGGSYTEPLSDHLTYYIIGDPKGNVWLTHCEPNERYPDLPDQVLYRYDGQRFSKILEKDEENDFQLFGKMADREGNIWFGTMHGICRYDGKSFTYMKK